VRILASYPPMVNQTIRRKSAAETFNEAAIFFCRKIEKKKKKMNIFRALRLM